MIDWFLFGLFYFAPGWVHFWREIGSPETWVCRVAWYGRPAILVACAIECIFWPFLWSVVRR